MDARTFLGMEPAGDDLRWVMPVEPGLTTPRKFPLRRLRPRWRTRCPRGGVGPPHGLGDGPSTCPSAHPLSSGLGGNTGRRRGLLTDLIGKIGENIKIRRFVRYEVGEGLAKRADDFVDEVKRPAGQA